jgi:hypothetical protein
VLAERASLWAASSFASAMMSFARAICAPAPELNHPGADPDLSQIHPGEYR